jgi:hypothetical protein
MIIFKIIFEIKFNYELFHVRQKETYSSEKNHKQTGHYLHRTFFVADTGSSKTNTRFF